MALRGHFRRQLGSSPAAYRAAYRARRPQSGTVDRPERGERPERADRGDRFDRPEAMEPRPGESSLMAMRRAAMAPAHAVTGAPLGAPPPPGGHSGHIGHPAPHGSGHGGAHGSNAPDPGKPDSDLYVPRLPGQRERPVG